MIKLLDNNYKDLVLEYLSKEPSINLFFIGDIENFGLSCDFIDLWGTFDSSSNLTGLLLRFYNNFIVYSQDSNTDFSEFKSIISSYNDLNVLSGKKSIIENFKDCINNYVEEECFFTELNSSNNLFKYDDTVKKADLDDVEEIYNLYNSIDEFAQLSSNRDSIINSLQSNSGRYYFIKENNKIVSIAQSTAENSQSAMIVGVATLKNYRRKGLVTKCLSKLCTDLLKENKTLCLFYDNPEAGKIYKKLGFKAIDKWTMLINKNH